jgi:hypothetical protein
MGSDCETRLLREVRRGVASLKAAACPFTRTGSRGPGRERRQTVDRLVCRREQLTFGGKDVRDRLCDSVGQVNVTVVHSHCLEPLARFLVNFFSHSISIFVRSVNSVTFTHGEKEV